VAKLDERSTDVRPDHTVRPSRKQKLPNGFVEVYRYRVVDGAVKEAKVINDSLWHEDRVVYLRVCDDEVLYVGKCDGTLSRRIARHIDGFRTSEKEMFRDYKERVNGKTVSIMAYKPEQVEVFGRKISVHTGLEYALIDEFDPPFVKRR
jgi:hypothetical protein